MSNKTEEQKRKDQERLDNLEFSRSMKNDARCKEYEDFMNDRDPDDCCGCDD